MTLERPKALEVRGEGDHPLRLWYLAAAQASAQPRPAILLLHGRTWSSIPDFDLRVGDDPQLSLMHTLAAEGFATYALDMRGYGESERDSSGWNEPNTAAEDVFSALSMIRAREKGSVDLLGWSYGALVAHLTVQRHPGAADKLVLYGYPREPEALRKAPPAGALAAEQEQGEAPRKPTTDAAARSDFITPGSISDEAIAAFATSAVTADPTRADWRKAEHFGVLDPAQIDVPTLVIHGVGDPIAREPWQAQLFRGLGTQDRQWALIPGTDHAAHLEDPDAFVRTLLGFLGRA